MMDHRATEEDMSRQLSEAREQRADAAQRVLQLEEICQWAMMRLPERYRETFKAKLDEDPGVWIARPRHIGRLSNT